MADLGNIGRATYGTSICEIRGFAFLGSQPLANTISGTGATANSVVVLMRANHWVDTAKANGSGAWSFYDYSNGQYTVFEPGTTNVWSVSIVANTPTVTKLSSTPPSFGYAFIE